MFLGRLAGWVLVAVAVVLASADGVMALAPADYAGIATSEVLTLLTGDTPGPVDGWGVLATLQRTLLNLPAWVVVGAMGGLLLLACRRRVRRHMFRR